MKTNFSEIIQHSMITVSLLGQAMCLLAHADAVCELVLSIKPFIQTIQTKVNKQGARI